MQPKTDDLKEAVLPKAEIPKSLDEDNEGEKKVVRKYSSHIDVSACVKHMEHVPAHSIHNSMLV